MAGWNHSNANWKHKKCVVCESEFIPKSGIQKFCSTPCKGKWKYLTGQVTTETQYKDISGNWKRYLARLQYAAGRKRDSLTVDILLKKLEQQDYKCALSGVPLTCNLEKNKKFPRNVSIDRIIPGGPYTEENIQLVCKCLNSWRSDTELGEFIDMCRLVAKHFDKRESEV